MDKAKAKAAELLNRSGHHDTTVHEEVAPAVTQESVKPTRHENVQTVVDKEIHQDHYHTSVQPVVDKQVLPEQHHHVTAPAEERTFQHGAPDQDKSRAAVEAAQFKDERVVNETRHTSAEQPAVAGEHVHHHVHETIQPVVQKETIQPEIVHTTKPIHEVHHHGAQHHQTTALPAVSKEELERKGGTLLGRGERYDHFEGEPKYAGLEGTGPAGATGTTGTTGTTGGIGTTGTTGTTSNTLGTSNNTTSTTNTSGAPISDTSGGYSTGTTGTTQSTSKPSLMDKLNPKKDTDGDGKAGIMK